jgi:hypothetical protein
MFLTRFYKAEQIEISISDTIEFVDQGANFESVSCNLCGSRIDIEYWQTLMDNAFEEEFTNLTIIAPCCSQKTTLQDLTYILPAGFAKFIIIVSNPQIEITDLNLNELKSILGTSLRVIWAHY